MREKKIYNVVDLNIEAKQPGNDIDVYIDCFDAYKKEDFKLRYILLWTINDFRAYGNLSGCVVKGYCMSNVR